MAAELVRLNVDLILTAGDLPLRAAREATKTIPIVVALIGDLVGPGYVASLARPGGNITGLTSFQAELSSKRLELLKAAFPSVARVAFLWNPDNAPKVAAQRETQGAAKVLRGIQLLSVGVRTFNDLESAFRVIPQSRADALMTVGDVILATYRAQIVDFATKHRLPAMYANREFVELGGLMSYASDPHENVQTRG